MVELAEDYAIINHAVMVVAELAHNLIAHLDILQTDAGANFTVFTDYGIAFNPGLRIDNRIAANLDIAIHISGIRVHNRNTISHEFFILAAAQDFFSTRELHAGVNAQRGFIIISCYSPDFLTLLLENFEHIRQVVFTLGIVIRNLLQGGKERAGIKAVDAGVYFLHRTFCFRSILMLHDLEHAAIFGTDDAAIARGIRHDCREHRSLSLSFYMGFIEFFQQITGQKRRITTKNHYCPLLIL